MIVVKQEVMDDTLATLVQFIRALYKLSIKEQKVKSRKLIIQRF